MLNEQETIDHCYEKEQEEHDEMLDREPTQATPSASFAGSIATPPTSYTTPEDMPEAEWGCNRCMYVWDGNGGWCPMCNETATHGKAFDKQ